MRIVPHHQDTGGFFVALLEKVEEKSFNTAATVGYRCSSVFDYLPRHPLTCDFHLAPLLEPRHSRSWKCSRTSLSLSYKRTTIAGPTSSKLLKEKGQNEEFGSLSRMGVSDILDYFLFTCCSTLSEDLVYIIRFLRGSGGCVLMWFKFLRIFPA